MKRSSCLFMIIALIITLMPGLTSCQPAPAGPVAAAGMPAYPDRADFDDYSARRAMLNANQTDPSTLPAIEAFALASAVQILPTAGTSSCYSPLSLYFALALAGSGAAGTTGDELLDVLGITDRQTLADESGRLYRCLYIDDQIGRLKIANSIWMDNDMNGVPVTFKADFVKTAAESFYASAYEADFSSPLTGQAMGRWIADNTGGKLSPTIATDPAQILSIINTIDFYDEWTSRFNAEATQPDLFHLADGSTVSCDFMNEVNPTQSFSRGANYTRASLQLKHNGSMSFILPDEGVPVTDLLASTDALTEALHGGESRYGEVSWSIPKFSFGTKLDLGKTLQDLGVISAFQREADFSGITDSTCFISQVIQETHIAINEEGVAAAAYTRIDFAGSAVPEDQAQMILNRPFLYCITDTGGAILFIGICGDPSAA